MNTTRLVIKLAFLGCLFYAGDRALSQDWAATSSPSKWWRSIASSADGTKVVAADGSPGLIYVSKDAGSNWTATTAPPDYWNCVASSADGAKLVAVSCSPNYYQGHVYTSTDSGTHWVSNSPPAGFDLGISVASSANGTKLVMISFNSNSGTFTAICASTNSGSTWTVPSQPYNLSSSWNCVASSSDGTKLVAAEGYLGLGHIYRSIDSGRTWSATSAPTTNAYVAIACSADGSHLLAARNDGRLYTSTNSGTTWLAHNVPWDNSTIGSSRIITGVASSANGTRFFAVTSTGLMYTSTNAGVAWTSNNVAVVPWTAVTCSTNGTKAFAATGGGSIYASPYSGNWKLSSAPGTNWTSVASSADGTHLVAAATDRGSIGTDPATAVYPGGPIYTSTNSGAFWSRTSAVSNWVCVTSSADGSRLAAASYQYNSNAPAASHSSFFTSANAGGAWTQSSAPDRPWTALAASADGQNLVAVAGGSIYTSANAGGTWTSNSVPSGYPWTAVASSADGTQLVATAGYFNSFYYTYFSYIYRSANSGVTWTKTSATTTYEEFSAIASSADGSHLVAATSGSLPNAGPLYTSSDSGATWTMGSVPAAGVAQVWRFVASSADGSRLIVMDTFGRTYVSGDAGASWALVNAPALPWTALALSADGSTLVAAFDGGIYVSQLQISSLPALRITHSGSSVILSWPTNATGFGLQQSSALGSPNWVGVSNPVSIVNARNQVSVTATNRANFYRLKSP
jgi:photosystem II stability/assembly factor-like uncharacterized protein